jgi:sugar phosphate isomerase/epimerase
MKAAYMVATQDIMRDKILCLKGDYAQIFQLVSRNGYTGIELMVKNPFAVDFITIERSAKEYRLDIPMICTGEMFREDGLSFGDPRPEIRREAIRRSKELMKIAEQLRAYVNVGRLRGEFQSDILPEDTIAWVKDGFSEVAACNPNVCLLLEPVNHINTNYLLTTSQGMSFIKELNIPNVKLMLDYMHMIIENEDIECSLASAKGWFKHVHICDSDRKPPGQGTFKFDPFFKLLHKVEYDGYVSIEARPTQDYAFDLKKSFQVISPLLNGNS